MPAKGTQIKYSPFFCPKCGHRTRIRGTLPRQLKLHEELRFTCVECGFSVTLTKKRSRGKKANALSDAGNFAGSIKKVVGLKTLLK